jgi:hypothetical protein
LLLGDLWCACLLLRLILAAGGQTDYKNYTAD